MKHILTFLICCSTLFVANAQTILSEADARKELKERGIDEKRFTEELEKRGINLAQIDPNNPEELIKAEKSVREVLDQLEKEEKDKLSKGEKKEGDKEGEKKKEEAIETVKDEKVLNQAQKPEEKKNVDVQLDPKDIANRINKGASLEKAISESIHEQKLKMLASSYSFGHQIFRDNSLQLYKTISSAKPPKSYVLGPKDVITISIFGASEKTLTQEISSEGYVKFDALPRFYLAGLTIEEAEKMLQRVLRNYYSFDSGSFAFAVTTSRSINVNIFGEVFNNGTFNISALNSAFNALVAAGGPTDIGSVRNIKLMRAGKEARLIDVYKYLNNPVVSEDLYLQDNDYIHVPVAQKVVSIVGEVTRQFKYELLEGESLVDLIKFAGGLKANALKRNIQIKRFENDLIKIYSVNYIDIESGLQKFELKNGDEIIVDAIEEDTKNQVSILGAVESPGTYAFEPNMKLTDLLAKGKLKDNAILETGYIKRLNADQVTVKYEIINVADAIKNPTSTSNITLRKGDVLTVRASADFVRAQYASIQGAVRIPGAVELNTQGGLRVSDAIFLAGGTQEYATDFAYIFRKSDEQSKTMEYIYVDLKKALTDENSPSNISLEPRDSLVVYSSFQFEDKANVTINGAVRKPGEFLYNPSLTIKDLIRLAGGFTRDASTSRIDVFRIEVGKDKKTRTLAAQLSLENDFQGTAGDYIVQPFDQVYVRRAPEYELQNTVTIDGEIVYPGPYAMIKENTRLSDVILQSGGLTNESAPDNATLYRAKDGVGFIVINLSYALKNKGNFQDIILKDGDEIYIPKRSGLISIEGAVRYKGQVDENNGLLNIAFEGEKDAEYYINKYAAGFAENADKDKTFVKHSNGKVDRVKKILFHKSFPKVKEGSVIHVPYKEEKKEKDKEDKSIDWGDVLKDSITQATAILSLILLIQSVN